MGDPFGAFQAQGRRDEGEGHFQSPFGVTSRRRWGAVAITAALAAKRRARAASPALSLVATRHKVLYTQVQPCSGCQKAKLSDQEKSPLDNRAVALNMWLLFSCLMGSLQLKIPVGGNVQRRHYKWESLWVGIS